MPNADVLLTPIDVRPAYAAVVERLRRAIALGAVLPGERLPSERALADSFGVSRVTVREALRVLQGEGVIVTRRGGAGGAVVAVREQSMDEIRDAYRRTRPRIDDVFEYRLAVETMAARLAAERGGAEHLERLRACQAALLASDGIGSFRRADSAFHLAVADASGNAMLRQAIEDARAVAFDTLDIHPFTVLRESSAAGHGAVIAAIERGAPDDAADAMAAHLDQARREVLSVLFGDEDPSSPAGRPASPAERH